MTLPNYKEREAIIRGFAANKNVAWNIETGLIHHFVGGSALHGASVGSADLDLYGIFIEKPEYALGIHGNSWETFQSSTAGDQRKNTADDVDVCVHSLRKWARLAASGNPTIMGFLFAPVEDHSNQHWNMLRANKHLFLAKEHVDAFLGYAKQQYYRLNGLRAQDTNRPELIERYGFDTKMAMHMIRLMTECREMLLEGTVTYPRPDTELLIDIRQGKYTLEYVNKMYLHLACVAEDWKRKSTLPEKVDSDKISRLVARIYHEHWELYDFYPQEVRWT